MGELFVLACVVYDQLGYYELMNDYYCHMQKHLNAIERKRQCIRRALLLWSRHYKIDLGLI